MDLDFPLILSWAVIISGSIWLVDTFAFKQRIQLFDLKFSSVRKVFKDRDFTLQKLQTTAHTRIFCRRSFEANPSRTNSCKKKEIQQNLNKHP